MSYWICHACRHTYEVIGSKEEIDGLLGKESSYPCITDLCQGRLTRVPVTQEGWREAGQYPVEDISLRSFFRAAMGFGKFDTNPADPKRVRELFLTKKIVDVVIDPVGEKGRTIVQQFVMDDGTRLHFGNSSFGACCYYVEAAGPSCVEVLDREQPNMVPSERAVESSDSDRKEGGRASCVASEINQARDSDTYVLSGATSVELAKANAVPSMPKTSKVFTGPDSGQPGVNGDRCS
jgi:hypothetical protein